MNAPDPTPMVGAVIAERYEVVRILGRGANGAVCEVVDRTTGSPAALKIVVGEDADLAGRLVREGKALSMLAHSHIVALIDTGLTSDRKPYVVTELIHGTSLRDILDREIIAPRRALEIVRQLLEALDHAHGVGMIHRDVKPENIMLVEAGHPNRIHVKLLDFGVAKVLDPDSTVLGESKLTRAGLEVFGSPPYIAPETAIGEPIDNRTDLYSVGVVLFELLTSRVPFDHEDTTTLLRMHVTDVPPLLQVAAPDRRFTRDLQQLVSQALEKLPDRRFDTAIDMHVAIQAVERSLDAPDDGEPSTVVHRERLLSEPSSVTTLASVPPPPQAMPQMQMPPPIPANVGVPASSRLRRIWRDARQFASGLSESARRHPRRVAAIGTGGVALLLVLVFAVRSSATADPVPLPIYLPPPGPDLSALAQPWVTHGDGELARRRFGRAIADYERAMAIDHALVRDDKVRASVAQIASRGDAVAAVIALELLATRFDPPSTKTIAEQAAAARLPDVRRRAFAIAERDGFANTIDRFASWTLDLRQIANCDDRRETVAKLRELGDKRAIEILQRIRNQACITKEVTATIEHLQELK